MEFVEDEIDLCESGESEGTERNGTTERAAAAGRAKTGRKKGREEGSKGGSAAGRVNSESGREMAPVLLCLAPATSSPSIESTLIINVMKIVPQLKVPLLQVGYMY